jgi:hypothetical protein
MDGTGHYKRLLDSRRSANRLFNTSLVTSSARMLSRSRSAINTLPISTNNFYLNNIFFCEYMLRDLRRDDVSMLVDILLDITRRRSSLHRRANAGADGQTATTARRERYIPTQNYGYFFSCKLAGPADIAAETGDVKVWPTPVSEFLHAYRKLQ